MRITRSFIRSLPLGHNKTYCNVDEKSFFNVCTVCKQVSNIDRKFDYIIKRNMDDWSVNIEVKPYGYRKGLQSASPNEQGSLGEGDRTGGVD